MANEVSQNSKILAGVLTSLLTEIKNEFKTRANPWNNTRLDKVTFSSINDTKNAEITAS